MGTLAQIIDGSEQVFGLEHACEKIPMPSMPSLYQFLSKHKQEFPPHYQGRKLRVLTETEIIKIRSILFTDEPVYARQGRPKGARDKKPRSFLETIIRRASNA